MSHSAPHAVAARPPHRAPCMPRHLNLSCSWRKIVKNCPRSSAMRHHTAAAAPRWLAAAALCCVVGHGVEAGNGKIVAVPHGNRVPDGAGDCPLGLSHSAFESFPGRCVAAIKRATHAANLACVLQYQCRLECGCQPSRCRALCKVLLCTIAVAVGGPRGADDHCRAPPHVLCDRHGLEEGRNRR
jgi:hypothetical protein